MDFFQKLVKMAEYDPNRAETVGDSHIFIPIRPHLKFNFTYWDQFLELYLQYFLSQMNPKFDFLFKKR